MNPSRIHRIKENRGIHRGYERFRNIEESIEDIKDRGI